MAAFIAAMIGATARSSPTPIRQGRDQGLLRLWTKLEKCLHGRGEPEHPGCRNAVICRSGPCVLMNEATGLD